MNKNKPVCRILMDLYGNIDAENITLPDVRVSAAIKGSELDVMLLLASGTTSILKEAGIHLQEFVSFLDTYQEISRSADITKVVTDLKAARRQQRGGDK